VAPKTSLNSSPPGPFTSSEQAVFITLLRTAEQFQARNAEFLKAYDLSPTQYNALRILRGAGKAGLPCSEVGERMINKDPDITRLLGRLEKRGYVTRSRDKDDRRVNLARMTQAGLEILRRLDRPTEQFLSKLIGHLGPQRLIDLLRLLEAAREKA
jgi:DNA-binding MarR family transcriptional regulator